MRTGNVSPTVGRFKKASTRPNKTSYTQDKLNKLRRDIPAQRPQVEGVTYKPLRVKTNSKFNRYPLKVESYSIKLHITAAEKLRASRAKPQPKPHGDVFVIKTVIRDASVKEWSAAQRKAWRTHNKANPTHQIHY